MPALIISPSSEALQNLPEGKDISLHCKMNADFHDCILCLVVMEWRDSRNQLLLHARYNKSSRIRPEIVYTIHDPIVGNTGNYTCLATVSVIQYLTLDVNSTVHVDIAQDNNTILWIATLIVVLILGISVVYCCMSLIRSPSDLCSQAKRKDSYNVEEAARLGVLKYGDTATFGGDIGLKDNERAIL
uniref:Ig-like domain-containing protein n=1 Tax=Acrobeloides nanus TaxID=290746 RepID=A0A914CG49_9BILA